MITAHRQLQKTLARFTGYASLGDGVILNFDFFFAHSAVEVRVMKLRCILPGTIGYFAGFTDKAFAIGGGSCSGCGPINETYNYFSEINIAIALVVSAALLTSLWALRRRLPYIVRVITDLIRGMIWIATAALVVIQLGQFFGLLPDRLDIQSISLVQMDH